MDNDGPSTSSNAAQSEAKSVGEKRSMMDVTDYLELFGADVSQRPMPTETKRNGGKIKD